MSLQIIEHIEVGSGGAASVTFSSIPQTYTDLILKISARIDAVSNVDDIYTRPNGSTTNFTTGRLYGRGNIDSDTYNSQGLVTGNSATANSFGNAFVQILNYTASKNKSIFGDSVTENNSTSNGTYYQIMTATRWADTSPITSLTIASDNDWRQYSTFTLFGRTAGSDGTTTVS